MYDQSREPEYQTTTQSKHIVVILAVVNIIGIIYLISKLYVYLGSTAAHYNYFLEDQHFLFKIPLHETRS